MDIHCNECGYDLRGQRHATRCPECGNLLGVTINTFTTPNEPAPIVDRLIVAPRGIIFIATLLFVGSINQLFTEVTSDGLFDSWSTFLNSEPIRAYFFLAGAATGFATAYGLWNTRRWSRWSYLAWLVMFLGAAAATDSNVEPEIGKVIVGVLFRSLLPVGGAIYLFLAFKRYAEYTEQPDVKRACKKKLSD